MGTARAWRTTGYMQAAYYLLTGIWPILHLPSFEAVTGPKTDDWLVRLFGAIVTVIGLVILEAVTRGSLDRSVYLLATGIAAVLAAGDVVFVALGVISAIYLVDAALQILILCGWLFFKHGADTHT